MCVCVCVCNNIIYILYMVFVNSFLVMVGVFLHLVHMRKMTRKLMQFMTQ